MEKVTEDQSAKKPTMADTKARDRDRAITIYCSWKYSIASELVAAR